MVRKNYRNHRVLAWVVAEMRKDVETGVRFPRNRTSILQFVFAIHGVHVRREREMVRGLPFHLQATAQRPCIIHRRHVPIMRIGLRHRQQRIRIVSPVTRKLPVKILGTVTKPKLRGRSRLEAARQVGIVKIGLPVTAISGITEQMPVGGIGTGKVDVGIERTCRLRIVVQDVGHGTRRKDVPVVIAAPVKTARPRKNTRLVILGSRPTELGIIALDNMVFVQNSAAQPRTQDFPLEALVKPATDRGMDLLVGVDERGLSPVVVDQFAESRRIAQSIAQVFADKARMHARSEPGIVFRTNYQVFLFTRDDVHGIHLVKVSGGILLDGILIGAVQRTQRPRVAQGIRTAQLGKNVEGGEVERVRRFHVAIFILASSIALAELGIELLAQVLEHFAI